MRVSAAILLTCLFGGGCAAIPEVRHEPQFHNPFPQLHRVAILPFFNLSDEPTVNQDDVAHAYYTELQQIPGFEVVPPGVVKQFLAATGQSIDGATDFQQLARDLGVDVLIRGAVTEYSPYYPPRVGLAVDWFAANPSFHPIPPGYGLPWGTPEQEYIPESLVREAEFALAREQLKTQTPEMPPEAADISAKPSQVRPAGGQASTGSDLPAPDAAPEAIAPGRSWPQSTEGAGGEQMELAAPGPPVPELPVDWPDPRGFIPPPPSPVPPPPRPQGEPIISHTRIYDSSDQWLTERLEHYYFFRDDARHGGWQGYLTRSQDYIRFCCYLNITEILAARGGAGQTRVVWRWPIGRYEVGAPGRR
jgi:hypothetical protein